MMPAIRSIAVTGSAGRIGRAICTRARRDGLAVIGIDTVDDEASRIADIRNSDHLTDLFDGIDCVIHCAGLHAPHVGNKSDDAFRSININGTESVLRAIERAGVGRIVLSSSTAVYGGGSPAGKPARWIDEMSQPAPRTIYHTTKLEAEAIVRSVTGTRLAASIVRLGRCFPEGPMLTALYRLSRGISEADAASAHLCAANATDQDCEPLIACATSPFQREDVDELGLKAPTVIRRRCPEVITAFETRGWAIPGRVDRVYDSSKAQKCWRWQPRDGYQATLERL